MASHRPEPAPLATTTPAGIASPAQPRPPPQVHDHELLCRIGGGSYGEVWLARSVMGTYRAVKAVYRSTFQDDRPFQREFAGIQKFEPISRSHEGLVNILQVGKGEAYFYYVMELADDADREIEKRGKGETERIPSSPFPLFSPASYVPRTLRHEYKQRDRLPVEECLKIGHALASALAHLHDHGLIHRDVKPSNIIFVNGAPKLADIGLVTDVDATHSYVGTEGYIPPEGPGSPQSDLYSLGKVLYEISTGKDRLAFPEPPTLVDGSAEEIAFLEFQEVLLKACEPNLKRRYQTARELRADLELLQGGKSVKRLHVLERRLAVLTKVGLIFAVLLAIAAGAYFFARHETRQAQREARRADQEAARAKIAEQDAREKLRDSYLAQAQARRRSGRAGRRFESLDALRRAAEIRPSVELRNEAIACLALVDLRTTKVWDSFPAGNVVALENHYERYARAEDSGAISIRRIEDDRQMLLLPGFGAPFAANLAFSPDDHLLAATYKTDLHQLCVWDLERREIIFKPAGLHCRTFAFSPDSRSIAVAQFAGPLKFYDLASGEMLKTFPQESLVFGLQFDPGGKRFAVSSQQSSTVEIRDSATGNVIHSLAHANWILGLAWSPGGNFLATACGDWNVYLWDAASGNLRAKLAGHQGAVVTVNFNHRGDLLESFAWDGTLRLWAPLPEHQLVTMPVRSGGLPFSPDDQRLLILGEGPKVGICEVASAVECRLLCSVSKSIQNTPGCDFSADGRMLASTHNDGLRLWNVATGRETAFQPAGDSRLARFHPNGGLLITSGGTGLRKWPLEFLADGNRARFGAPELFGNREVTIDSLSLSQDGQTLVASVGGKVFVFEVATRDMKMQLESSQPTFSAVISPDAQWVAGAARGQSPIRVWRVPGGEVAKDLPAAHVKCLAFSPDSKQLVVGTTDEYRFWQMGNWQAAHSVLRAEGGDQVTQIAFTRDGKMAAIAHSGISVRLLETASGRELATFEMPDPQVISSLGLSPDGSQLAVGGRTPVIHLWNLRLIRQQLAAMKLDWE